MDRDDWGRLMDLEGLIDDGVPLSAEERQEYEWLKQCENALPWPKEEQQS